MQTERHRQCDPRALLHFPFQGPGLSGCLASLLSPPFRAPRRYHQARTSLGPSGLDENGLAAAAGGAFVGETHPESLVRWLEMGPISNCLPPSSDINRRRPSAKQSSPCHVSDETCSESVSQRPQGPSKFNTQSPSPGRAIASPAGIPTGHAALQTLARRIVALCDADQWIMGCMGMRYDTLPVRSVPPPSLVHMLHLNLQVSTDTRPTSPHPHHVHVHLTSDLCQRRFPTLAYMCMSSIRCCYRLAHLPVLKLCDSSLSEKKGSLIIPYHRFRFPLPSPLPGCHSKGLAVAAPLLSYFFSFSYLPEAPGLTKAHRPFRIPVCFIGAANFVPSL